MAKYYYEGSEILAPFTIVSNEPVYAADTISLKQQRASQSAQRWELSFSTVADRSAASDVFLAAVTGIDATKTMVMPQLLDVDDNTTLSGTVTSFATYAAGTSTLFLTDGAGNSGFLPKGSFIKFDNHNKVYVTTTDCDFDSGSSQTVTIFPSLRSEITATTEMQYGSDCVITYYRSIDNQQGITFQDGILSDAGTITVVEAL